MGMAPHQMAWSLSHSAANVLAVRLGCTLHSRYGSICEIGDGGQIANSRSGVTLSGAFLDSNRPGQRLWPLEY